MHRKLQLEMHGLPELEQINKLRTKLSGTLSETEADSFRNYLLM